MPRYCNTAFHTYRVAFHVRMHDATGKVIEAYHPVIRLAPLKWIMFSLLNILPLRNTCPAHLPALWKVLYTCQAGREVQSVRRTWLPGLPLIAVCMAITACAWQSPLIHISSIQRH